MIPNNYFFTIVEFYLNFFFLYSDFFFLSLGFEILFIRNSFLYLSFSNLKKYTLQLLVNVYSVLIFWFILNVFAYFFLESFLFCFNGSSHVTAFNWCIKLILYFFLFIVLILLEHYFLSCVQFKNHLILSLLFFSIFFLLFSINSLDLILFLISVEGSTLIFLIILFLNILTPKHIESSIKYFFLHSLSTFFFLFHIILVYFLYGSTNFLFIKYSIETYKFGWFFYKSSSLFFFLIFSLFFLFIFIFFKLSLFPCHFWLADLYEGFSTPFLFYFSTFVKLSVFYSFFKMVFLLYSPLKFIWSPLLILSSVGSMFFGGFWALVQKNIWRFLAYAAISQMGFLVLGCFSGHPVGFIGSLWFMVVYFFSFSILLIFLVNTRNIRTGKLIRNIKDLTCLSQHSSLYVGIFILNLLNLAGFPPFLGFSVKLNILIFLLHSQSFILAGLALFSNLISFFYYFRIIKYVYFGYHIQSKHQSIYFTRMGLGHENLCLFLVTFNSFFFFFNDFFLCQLRSNLYSLLCIC